jgi:hypothetical protein
MKTLLLKNWNLIRVLRLAIGVWAVIVAFQTKAVVLGLMGGILLVMALMNIGCCGISGCRTPMTARKNLSQKPEEVNYEEITKK